MSKFDKLYNELLIREGAFKSALVGGMLGAGALASVGAGGDTTHTVNTNVERKVTDDYILSKTVPFTKKWEGFREVMYYDTEDIPTIGYGSNLTQSHIKYELESLGYNINDLLSRRERINETDAKRLLSFGMNQALIDAKRFVTNWDDLDPIAKLIIIDMSYNLGATRLAKFVNFKAALKNLDYATAGEEMVDSKWYRQTKGRAKSLVSMMYEVAKRT